MGQTYEPGTCLFPLKPPAKARDKQAKSEVLDLWSSWRSRWNMVAFLYRVSSWWTWNGKQMGKYMENGDSITCERWHKYGKCLQLLGKNFRHFDWVMFNSKVLNLSGITIWKITEKNNMYQYEINDRGVESLKPRTKPEESKSERTVATWQRAQHGGIPSHHASRLQCESWSSPLENHWVIFPQFGPMVHHVAGLLSRSSKERCILQLHLRLCRSGAPGRPRTLRSFSSKVLVFQMESKWSIVRGKLLVYQRVPQVSRNSSSFWRSKWMSMRRETCIPTIPCSSWFRCVALPVVPHKAVAEVSKIGNL